MKSLDDRRAIQREYSRKWRERDPEWAREVQKRSYEKHKARKQTTSWRRMVSERGRARRAALRAEVIAAYGGKCVCCGDSTLEFLQIDHAHGDGAAHRKTLSGRGDTYKWLKKNQFPAEGFRLLCANCNWSVGQWGYCPHGGVVRERNVTGPFYGEPDRQLALLGEEK